MFTAGKPASGAALAVLGIMAMASATAQGVEKVQIGSQAKNAHGTIVLMEPGDLACYLTLKDDRGASFKEMAVFEICDRGKALLNRRLALKYELRPIQSPECMGDDTCKKTVVVAVVTDVREK